MPRRHRFTAAALIDVALPAFWRNGFSATSVADLTDSGGASRQAIYGVFRDKRTLFLACLDAYRTAIVDPAFALVERPNAGLADIAAFFEHQISAAERNGLPGPGCLFANTLVELAPSDDEIAAAVHAHLARLTAGFTHALLNAARGQREGDIPGWAALLTITAQGVWAVSRVAAEAEVLRAPVSAVLELIEGALRCEG